MSKGFLDKILASKREQVAVQKRSSDQSALKERALFVRANAIRPGLYTELDCSDRTNIIAEIKRASPSKGAINTDVDVARLATQYRDGGACALSVLTEENFFKGSNEDLITAREAVDLPILRKDFVVDKFQVYESAAIGADATLLIAAALNEDEMSEFLAIAQDELGMDAVVEIHDEIEFETATKIGARIIGVNNRDLKSFRVSLDVSRALIVQDLPSETLMIAESGITSRDEVHELRGLGFDGFLIGETLMKAADAAAALRELRGEK